MECPTGSGKMMTLFEMARELSNRPVSTFRRDASGRRPVFGGSEKFQKDPHWRDYLLFYEYFHGDNGAGIGASHQTGWTGLAARLIQLFGVVSGKDFLKDSGTGVLNRGSGGTGPPPGGPRLRRAQALPAQDFFRELFRIMPAPTMLSTPPPIIKYIALLVGDPLKTREKPEATDSDSL